MKAREPSRRGAVAGALVTLLLAAPAAAAWRSLVPIPFENHVYLDLYGFYERNDFSYGPVDSGWDDTFLREKVTFASSGFFYHPRFLQYQASLSEALKQERYAATGFEDDGFRHGTAFEYDIRLLLLPEHFYNLELFALQYEPLLREEAATQRNGLQRSYGGFLRYRRKPWFGHLRFNDDTIETGATTTDTRRLNAGGEYFRRFREGDQFSVAANLNPTRFSTSEGLSGTSSQGVVSGTVDVKRARLTASYGRDTIDQNGPVSGAINSDDRTGYGQLTAYLPLRFRTDVSYRDQDSTNSIRSPSETEAQEFDDHFKEFRFNLVHRLFESLDTTYMLLRDDRTSTGGDSNSLTNQLTFSYTKTIQPGRVLSGLSIGRADTESRGRAEVVNEPHAGTAVPGRFTLLRPNADPTSIIVYLRSPLPPMELVPLVENVNYVVSAVGNTFEIEILTLPPEFVLPGSYDLEVTYALEAGQFELRADTAGYNLSVELFNQLLTPYYGYTIVRSTVLSGEFPGVPVNSTSHTVGLRVQQGRFRGTAEYQRLDWDVSPFRAWREELQYVAPLDATTNLYAIASILEKHYPQGASPYDRVPYTDRLISATCNLQKQLGRRNMSLTAGATYSGIRGRVDSDSYSLNSSIVWKVGKLDVDAGLSAYATNSESSTFSVSRRDHGVLYVKARRTF